MVGIFCPVTRTRAPDAFALRTMARRLASIPATGWPRRPSLAPIETTITAAGRDSSQSTRSSAARAGVARHAAVDHHDRRAARRQQLPHPRRKRLLLPEPEARGQAVAEEDHARAGGGRAERCPALAAVGVGATAPTRRRSAAPSLLGTLRRHSASRSVAPATAPPPPTISPLSSDAEPNASAGGRPTDSCLSAPGATLEAAGKEAAMHLSLPPSHSRPSLSSPLCSRPPLRPARRLAALATMVADIGSRVTVRTLRTTTCAPRDGSVVRNGRLYFYFDDGIHGLELWASDGTASGTGMVRDICPGACGAVWFSSYLALAATPDAVFFAANDGVHGLELWRTDGTATGTRLVRDIRSRVRRQRAQDLLRARRSSGVLGGRRRSRRGALDERRHDGRNATRRRRLTGRRRRRPRRRLCVGEHADLRLRFGALEIGWDGRRYIRGRSGQRLLSELPGKRDLSLPRQPGDLQWQRRSWRGAGGALGLRRLRRRNAAVGRRRLLDRSSRRCQRLPSLLRLRQRRIQGLWETDGSAGGTSAHAAAGRPLSLARWRAPSRPSRVRSTSSVSDEAHGIEVRRFSTAPSTC